MRQVNVGILGAGRIGRVHAVNLSSRIPGARVLAIGDIDGAAADRVAAECGIPAATDDPATVLDHPDVEAVIICSSTDTHAPFIEEAAEAGKHIFCEKPVDLELESLDRALSRVEEKGVKLQVGFQRRFDPSFKKVRTLVQRGELGRPFLLRVTSRAPEPPPIRYLKGSGGLFLDMMIHDFDMARFLIGAEVEEVYAVGGARLSPAIGQVGDIDTAVVTLRFRNGAMGALDCCRRSGYGYDQRAEVLGDRGLARVENETASRTSVISEHGVQQELPLFSFIERYQAAYVAEMKEFLRCVVEDKIPPVTGADGRKAVVIGQAAGRSLRENRPVGVGEP